MSLSKPAEQKHGLPIYESHPPEWLPPSHKTAYLGFHGFHPPRPKFDEDLLSENNIRKGYELPVVSAETFSAQAVINESLQNTDTLSKLEELIREVFHRRTESVAISQHSFRMPMRVTLNDAKRRAWFDDLANPDVPLQKLGKSVPHGAKGHDLLDLLHTNGVTIPRAVWFLRVSGANETSGLRNKPSYNPLQYSVDWTNIVTSYLKKQISDIALPSAPRPGLNIKSSFKGILSDTSAREKWISRFTYSLKLLKPFYDEGLVDNRSLLVWIVQQMELCNLAQVAFIIRIADDYLEGIMSNRALSRPFVESCLCKLSEMEGQEGLASTRVTFRIVLQRLCLTIPDAFVSPTMWMKYSRLFADTLGTGNSNDFKTLESQAVSPNLLLSRYKNIKTRNEALLFKNMPCPSNAPIGSAIAGIQVLNSISLQTDLRRLPYFDLDGSDEPSVFSAKLDMLLTWSVTPLQFGDHRPFAAMSLIKLWRDRAGERASRRDRTPPDQFLQDILFDWLDTSEVAGCKDNLRAVTLLFGKLVKLELFSYAWYIQRLIARGEKGLSFFEVHESRHRIYLCWIPLYSATPSLSSQRKVTLYGVRARETPEDISTREIRKEIRLVLPGLFGSPAEAALPSAKDLLSRCSRLVSASRYEQVVVFRRWLMPVIEKVIDKHSLNEDSFTLRDIYSITVELMANAKCYRSMLEITLNILEKAPTESLLTSVLNTLQRFATIWACMNMLDKITSCLYRAHRLSKTKSRALMSLLVELDGGRYLEAFSRDQLFHDTSAFTLALQPVMEQSEPVPDVLPELLMLARDSDIETPSVLANHFWLRYRSSTDWAWKVWDNTVASLRQVPTMFLQWEERHACAQRYATFLHHVDRHLPSGLNPHVLKWLLGPGQSEVAALTTDAWDLLIVVLDGLVIDGALQTTTVLQGLVYPAWQIASRARTDQAAQILQPFQAAATRLCRSLLFEGGSENASMPLIDVQRLRTQKGVVYGQIHFPLLLSGILRLVSLENNPYFQEAFKEEIRTLRLEISSERDFRRGVYRDLELVRIAFEEELLPTRDISALVQCDSIKNILSAVAAMLGDTAITDVIEQNKAFDITSLNFPWKLTSSNVQFRLLFRHIAQVLSKNDQSQSLQFLDRLTNDVCDSSPNLDHWLIFAQLIRDSDNEVIERFVINGIKKLRESLESVTTRDSEDPNQLQRPSDLLKLLVFTSEPLRENCMQRPLIDSTVHESIFECIKAHFSSLESADVDETGYRTTTFIARVLQYILSFRVDWTARSVAIGSTILNSLFRLAVSHASSDSDEHTSFSLLIDTLYYLLDEMPMETSKAAHFDPFRKCPRALLSDVTSKSMPVEYRQQLLANLPYLPQAPAVENLAISHYCEDGTWVYESLVTNHPWEWTENLGEPINLPGLNSSPEKGAIGQDPVKNSASLSLALFGAQATGERISEAEEYGGPTAIGSHLSTFSDTMSSESVFQRDWRETRFQDLFIVDPITSRSSHGRESPMKSGQRSASRASSVASKSSGRGSSNSRSSGNTKGDVPVANSKSSKRKASTVSDDEGNSHRAMTGVSARRSKTPRKSRLQNG